MATTPQIEAKRLEVTQAESALIDALFAFETARDTLRDASRRRSGADLSALNADVAEKKAAFEASRQAQLDRIAELQALIVDFLPAVDPSGEGFTPEQAAAAEVAKLEASAAIVLLPLRIETRFDGDILKVRVYPDEIFMDSHERALTLEEQTAAKKYYDELNEKDNEQELWRDMVARFGVQRSAYILREMLPVFGTAGSSSQWWQSSFSCGGTIFGGHHEQLFFPEVQSRSSTWTRPGRAVLPDRWAFVTYRNGVRNVRLGNSIPEPLAMTADPKLREEGDLTVLNGDYRIDDAIRWTVDFERAVSVGMGIEIDQASAGFDRLIVVGVKSSIGALDTSLHLERLLDAHHYTRGLAMVRQGSPTNNTEQEPSPYPPKENAGKFSYGIERQRAPLDREFAHHCLPHDVDGHHLAMALGVPSGVLANVDRAYMHEVEHARSMNQVLWPATFGYYLRHLLFMWNRSEADQVFTPERIADAKRYFTNYVLARGPAPAFRVGGTPYGVLPITALRLWQPRNYASGDLPGDEESKMATIEGAIRKPLLSLLEVWKHGISHVPRIRTDQANPDLDVARVLSTYPSSREFRVRTGESENVNWAKYTFLGIDITALLTTLDQQTNDTFGLIGYPNWRPRLGRTVFATEAALYTGDVVAPQVSETQSLPTPNFISGIASASIQELNTNGNVNGKPESPNLLYAVLRHSTLMEYWREHSEWRSIVWIGFDIFGLPSIPLAPLLPPLYSDPPDISAHLNALERIAYESTAELERLFTETLDLASHRLDAWLTAFAYRRLDDMRRSQVATQLKPKGNFLGGYGWVENLKPEPRGTEDIPGVGTVETQFGNGGFIHTPSMTHAAAAAVLRNGHISFKHENAGAHAVDLSSRRVRKARRLFQGVRNGQPLGALLGYELERALEDDYGSSVPDVHRLRYALRSIFPLVANKSGLDSTEPAESIAARNVVDGSLLLRRARPENGGLPYGTRDLPAPGTALHGILEYEIGRLAELYDAVADLLTAEGVFQLVRGNIDAAVPTINNVAQGAQPPESIISRSARGGIGIAHKVSLIFPSDALPALPSGWSAPATARADAEPILNAWVGRLVGDATQVSVVVKYFDADGNVITSTDPATSNPRDSVNVKLSELGLHPLDLLAMAEAIAQHDQGSLLDRRFIDVALNDPARRPDAPASRVQVIYASGSARTIPEIFEVLNTANAVLAQSRPLDVRDLVAPADIDEIVAATDGEGAPTDTHALDFRDRATAASVALTGARDALRDALSASAGLRAALKEAARFEVLSAYPAPLLSDAELRPPAEGALRELERRIKALPASIGAGSARSTLIGWAIQTLKAVFGQSFVALPLIEPPNADELQRSLEARDTLLTREGSGTPPVVDEEAPDRYLTQLMRSRPRLGRFRKLNLYARTAKLPRSHVDVVQLPHTPGERWLGLPFETPPEEGRAAFLLLNDADELDPTLAWAGLVVDDWTEIIPNQKEDTGIAFHYESPRAQAPQAVLVATPAKSGASWSFEELIGALEQTMDLMKIRAVDRDFLPIAQLLPASVFATNATVENVVSTAIAPLAQDLDAQGLEDG